MSKRKAPVRKHGMEDYCYAGAALLLLGLVLVGAKVWPDMELAPGLHSAVTVTAPVIHYDTMSSQTVELMADGKGHGSGVIMPGVAVQSIDMF